MKIVTDTHWFSIGTNVFAKDSLYYIKDGDNFTIKLNSGKEVIKAHYTQFKKSDDSSYADAAALDTALKSTLFA